MIPKDLNNLNDFSSIENDRFNTANSFGNSSIVEPIVLLSSGAEIMAHKKGKGFTGRNHTEVSKRKISLRHQGVELSKEHKKSISLSKLRELNPNWKGDNVGYGALHRWINRNKPKPKLCECCGKNPSYDLANISGEYKRDVNDYEWICRICHMEKDGRLKKLIEIGKRDKSGNKNPMYGRRTFNKKEYMKEYYKKNRERFNHHKQIIGGV